MKLLSLSEFIHLPAGTIFKKRSSQELQVKGDWVSDDHRDWSSMLLAAECADTELVQIGLLCGESYPIDIDAYGRDGCFDNQEQFLIYEDWDLQQLRALLDKAIEVSPKQIFKK